MPILESPAATANAILKGGVAVKLYLGEIGVAPVIVAISVKRGELVTAFVPPFKQVRKVLPEVTMRESRTRDVLDVVWHENGGGEFRKGVLAYGYFAEHHPAEPPFPAGAWPAGTRIDTTTFTDEDDKTYAVILWTILPAEWPHPDRWCETLRLTLQAFTAAGASVAWCAVEGSFRLPPKLFDPDEMTDEVYVVLLGDNFVCSAALDKRYVPLSRDQMVEFREETKVRLRKARG